MKMVARYTSIVIMVLLVAALSTSTVLADPGHKGGHGKGNKGGNDSGSASLSVTGSLGDSNPYLAWGHEVYTVHGTGLGANEAVYISLASPGCCSGSKVWTDRNGEFSFSKATGAPGEYTATALQASGGGKFKQVGKVSFLVVE